ncbi:MAG: hypothetical protein H0W76_11800 [Pyrinomonadaceae bacterium]|nr:hypothetical protein [Pyrinomonadaceae bacterium]
MAPQKKRATANRGGNRGGNASAGVTRNIISEAPAKQAPGPRPQTKLHSVGGLMNERMFSGAFDARGTAYKFSFEPIAAVLNDKRQLELTGRFVVASRRGTSRVAPDVRATLIATQGGIGASPSRRQALTAATSTSGNVATPQQKQEQAKAPETKQESPEPSGGPAPSPLPVTEATGDLSFVGVMYLQFSPLDARALGVPIDLSRVQLNARLAPTSELERDLQLLYSDLVAAISGDKADQQAATRYVEQLNGVLKGARVGAYRPFDVEEQQTVEGQSAVALTATQVHPHFKLIEAAE